MITEVKMSNEAYVELKQSIFREGIRLGLFLGVCGGMFLGAVISTICIQLFWR